MAMTATDLKRLQREIKALKKRVAQLERRANGRRRVALRPRKAAALRPRKRALSENERADQILRRAGLLSEPTEKEMQLVAEWEKVPADERTRLLEEFRSAKLDKPLSDIILENRR